MPQTKFYGSQVGGSTTIPHSYTGDPLTLLRWDITSALSFLPLLPYIVFPFSPQNSGPLCELYPSLANLWAMFLHLVLLIMQIPFVLSVPFWLLFPLWSVVCGVGAFMVINAGVCYLLNGSEMEFPSQERYAGNKREHEHEQWIFLNGVAVGKTWIQSNVDRLALTFGRPVLGVHNKTNGIIFDVFQCLIQRNFTYATSDVRACYAIIKATLYKPSLTKVIFILHSQGGIEGGMILDWLLQEVPQDLLAKLEVYTFGNAANHFNNPHLHLLSQHAALKHPTIPATTKTSTSVHYHDPIPASSTTIPSINGSVPPPPPSPNRTTHQTSPSGKTIRHIEHYAHTSDFVAQWGVLAYTSPFTSSPITSHLNPPLSPTAPRYMGRVFERSARGHQMCLHYLDGMFPLHPAPAPDSPPDPNAKKRSWFVEAFEVLFGKEQNLGGIGGSGFLGVGERPHTNAFMDSEMDLGLDADTAVGQTKEWCDSKCEREGLEISYAGAHGEPLVEVEREILVRDMSGLSEVGVNGAGERRSERGEKGKLRVKDFSRLWLYVNGKSPKVDETDVAIARMATM